MKKQKSRILVLILAVLLVSVSACKNPFLKKMLVEEEKGESSAVPKHTVTFSVEGGHGTLKATVDGNEINSGDSVEQGKSVVFTAEPAEGYVREQWTNAGTAITEAGTDKTYTHSVTTNEDIKVSFDAPFIEGGASLILSPDKLDITVEVRTADSTPITVEGCTETTLPSGAQTVLHATSTRVILKGNITKLECRVNQLTALNVQGLTTLYSLSCHINQLTELNVQGLTALQTLECSYNQLTALNIQGLTALERLWCGGNQLTTLNMQGLTALESLSCYNNQLTALNVQSLTALQGLHCYNNKLTALNVQGLTALQGLHCDNNQLTALNVQGLSALGWLYCGNNQLPALNVQGLTALRTLRCYNNKLTAQAFTKLFDDLPARQDSDNGECILYTEESGVTEGNHKDFSTPQDLKDAFDNAKNNKKWKMCKWNGSWPGVEI